MLKKILFIAFNAILLASCTSEDMLDDHSRTTENTQNTLVISIGAELNETDNNTTTRAGFTDLSATGGTGI